MSRPPRTLPRPPGGKAERRGRALERQAFLAERAGTYDQAALDAAMAARLAADASAPPLARASAHGTIRPRAAATTDVSRWVPIGPSVVRRGQAEGRPRVTGRIRDLQVSADGRRAYAASARGGVWYTEDAGGTWAPVGGWAVRNAAGGGNNNAQTCGCLLVSFGATAADDYVMVGTGELVPWGVNAPANWGRTGGVGILAAAGPAAPPAAGAPTPPPGAPWEPDAGIAQFEGRGIFRMARRPGSTAGKAAGAVAAADDDQVLAATSAGLFRGTRSHVAGPPAVDRWTWTKLATLDAFVTAAIHAAAGVVPQVTDVLWLPGGANGRIVVAIGSAGVAFSDTVGVAPPAGGGGTPAPAWTWVTNLGQPFAAGLALAGRMSFSPPVGGTVYVLGEVHAAATATDTPSLWRIPSLATGTPSATAVGGVPPTLWQLAGGNSQRDYDQAIAADVVGGTDRVFLGGSAVAPAAPNIDYDASLWAFDVTTAGAPTLVPATGLARVNPPLPGGAGGDGADQPGLVGNNVHPDVHVIRAVTPPGGTPQLWVGCDGGVFVSPQGGRCNSFQPRTVGLATLEVGFHAAHPGSTHFVAIGCQDNGTQVRTGDTVWEEIYEGDGGGVAFHPAQPQHLAVQYTNGNWRVQPAATFIDPLHRVAGGNYAGGTESQAAAFYSGPATVRTAANTARLAIGTNRVWLSDDVGVAAPNSWNVIPVAPAGAAVADPTALAGGPVVQATFGVPSAGALGSVSQLRWASPTELLAVYSQGLVRYTENPPGTWTATVLLPQASAPAALANVLLTDVAPVPGTHDFYLVTGGDAVAGAAAADTCWFYAAGAVPAFNPTGLRHALDTAGPPVVLGPRDPAYSVVVDPRSPQDVYVGTVTGVWHSVRYSPTNHGPWIPFVNGLPQAAVQDLSVWPDPTAVVPGAPPPPPPAGAPQLLRAGLQSRGVWEVNLAADEAQRTYLRVHAHDDRRTFPTSMTDPQALPGAALDPGYASPDVAVRPADGPATAPTWQLPGGTTISPASVPPYQLWTFQTAFRWRYPGIAADAQATDQFWDLVELHRAATGLPVGRFIDRPLWDAVVRNTRLTAAGAVSAAPGDPLAVYRAPWQSAVALTAAATEVDLMELVVPTRPLSGANGVWHAFRERCMVDVLVHHRDTRPLAPNDAFVTLLWRSGPSVAPLLASAAAAIPAYAASLLTAAPAALPAGWKLAAPPGPAHVWRLGVPLDARLPRAMSIPLDLSAVPNGHRVLLLAIAGSSTDPLTIAPVGAPATVVDLARAWPYAALRLVRVFSRPP